MAALLRARGPAQAAAEALAEARRYALVGGLPAMIHAIDHLQGKNLGDEDVGQEWKFGLPHPGRDREGKAYARCVLRRTGHAPSLPESGGTVAAATQNA